MSHEHYGRAQRWWRADAPAEALCSLVGEMRAKQAYRETELVDAMCMYGDYPVPTFGPRGYVRPGLDRSVRVAWNVIGTVVDTLHAENLQSRPRPMFLTSGGSYKKRKQGEQCTKFTDGLLERSGFYSDARPRVLLSALCTGDGMYKVCDEGDEVLIETPYVGDIFVDEADGIEGRPRSIYEQRRVDRWRCAELYPKHEAEILRAPAPTSSLPEDAQSIDDRIMLIEGWRRPSFKGAGDGRHVLCVDGTRTVLVDEKWEDDDFPFVKVSWKRRPTGYWGAGVVEALSGLQTEINATLLYIQDLRRMRVNALCVERSSNVVKSQLSNEEGAVLDYTRTMPQMLQTPGLTNEDAQWLQMMYAQAYKEIGVSEMATRGETEPGITSGRALRIKSNLHSKRFVQWGRDDEQATVQVARLAVKAAERIAERNHDFEVVYRDKSRIERIRWSDIRLDDSDYVLHVFPTAMLPSEPQGRLAALEEMFNAGLIDRDAFLRLGDFPDMESERDLLVAPREVIEQELESMVDGGEYMPPEPFDDHAMAMRVGILFYHRARLQGVPEERLDMIRQYLSDVQALTKPPAPPPALQPPETLPGMPPPPPPPDAGMGMGGPMPMPQAA